MATPHLGAVKGLKPCATALLTGLLAGCAPHYVNLTPNFFPRAASHDYPFEVEWQTRRTGANNPDVRAYVIIDQQFFPLQRVPQTENRFAGHAPIPADRYIVPYRYKFDYFYPGMPGKVVSSDLSPEYRLTLPPQ